MVKETWLPQGHHWGLHISHRQLVDSGPFTEGGRKQIWHTTEGTSLEGAFSTLQANRDAPHVILDIRTGETIQTIPFDRAARALEHIDPPETNRAHCWQVELCGFAADSGKWSTAEYDRIAALAVLMEHRTGVPRYCHHRFAAPTPKLTPEGFVKATGHLGHVHVPGNSHTDPGTGFRIGYLFQRMQLVQAEYQ